MAKNRRQDSRRQSEDAGQPLISVCMIVKDEESCLERCLNSVRPIADQIVVVDTGSSDRTVEIAQKAGAETSYFQWNDDFAGARNAALAKANGAWVLQMDADEELSPRGAAAIRQLVKEAPQNCWGFIVPSRSYALQDGCRVHVDAYRLLVFRNSPDLRYKNRIHEVPVYSGAGPEPDFVFDDDIVIEHYGYMPDQVELKEKGQRNLSLLQLAVAERPDDPFHQFNLGIQHYIMGSFAEAIEPLRRAIALTKDPLTHYLPTAYGRLIGALSCSGREKEVPSVIAEAESRVPVLTSDFYCNSGEGLRRIGQLDRAIIYFRHAIEVGNIRLATQLDPGTHTWAPRLGIGYIYETRGELDRALTWYSEAHTFVPDHPVLNCRLAVTEARLSRHQRSLEYVKAALRADDVPQHVSCELLQLCDELADAAAAEGKDIPELEGIAGEVAAHVSPAPEIALPLARVCARFKKFDLGIAAANLALEQGDDVLALANRGFCYLGLRRFDEAVSDFTKALELYRSSRDQADSPSRIQLEEMARTLAAHGHVKRKGNPAETRRVSVSIVIPISNQVDHTRRCIQAIAENTPEDLYEVIIVDNASTDGTADFLALLAGDIKLVTNKTNLGMPAARNQGAAEADGKYLVFLSNKAEPLQGWLESLISLAEADETVGAVAPKLIRPDGTDIRSEDPLLDCAREVEHCSTEAFLIRTDLWRSISRPNMSEACDLSSNIRQTGSRVMYQPGSMIISHEGEPRSTSNSFAAVYCVYDDDIWLSTSVESVYDSCDAIYFLVSDRPWHGRTTDNSATLNSIKSFPDPDRKIRIVMGSWTNETDQRNAGLNILERDGFLYCMVVDADEVYDPAELRQMMVYAMNHPEVDCWHMEWDTYWKSYRYCIEPREPFTPAVFVKVGTVAFTQYRLIGLGTHRLIPPEIGVCHHLSYARSDEQVLRKTSTFSHANELLPNWFEKVWKRWDADHSLTNLHPTHSASWQRAVPRPFSALTPALKRIYMADCELGSNQAPGLTSIIILACNQWHHTKRCLKSIDSYTPEPHEIIVIDNGSTDGTQAGLRTYTSGRSNIKVITSGKNLGFAGGNNVGLAVARGDYLVLLNNDTVVTEGWLGRIQAVLREHPEAGIVGPMSNSVVGAQYVPEATYETMAEMHGFAARWAADHSGQSVESPRVIGFCLLCRREVIERIGGLDERFGTGNFEDDDFCVRATLAGYQIRIARDAFVHHAGGQTFRGAGIDYRLSMARNWELFKAKWRIPTDIRLEDGYTVPPHSRDFSRLFVALPQLVTTQKPDPEAATSVARAVPA